MKEFKDRTLKTSADKKVKSRKQAVTIAMSESEGYSEKADLISQININSLQEAEDILKAAGTEDLFEKAKHQDGDMHPNGKWVWVSSANGGKGDWRTKGGRTHTKHSVGGNAGATATTQQKPSVQVVGTTKKISNDKQFLDTFRDASDDVLNKIVSGKIQASDREKKLAQQIIDERKKPKVGDVSKLTAQQKSMVDEVMDKGFLITSNKYNDKSKVELKKTPKGNWRCYYDGRDIGATISGKLISDTTAKKIGWYKEETKSIATTTQKKPSDDFIAMIKNFNNNSKKISGADVNLALQKMFNNKLNWQKKSKANVGYSSWIGADVIETQLPNDLGVIIHQKSFGPAGNEFFKWKRNNETLDLVGNEYGWIESISHIKSQNLDKLINDLNNAASKSNDTTQTKPKKRPIGVGTNGPEKRKKKSTGVDTLKYESKNGFKFKKNGHYKMRYNQREKAYEIWEEGNIYGTKIAMMQIKSENENIGMDIIKHMKEKYSKGGSGTMTYSNTTYAF